MGSRGGDAYCITCGVVVAVDARFCRSCGAAQPVDLLAEINVAPATGGRAAAETGPPAGPTMQEPDESTVPISAGSGSRQPEPAATRPERGSMAFTAKARAQTVLVASTTLPPQEALAVVGESTGVVKGGGVSLLTTGVQNLAAEVHVERETERGLGLSITSGKRLVELCTFPATASVLNGATELRVGGLETYKTTQSKLLYIIPVSPKFIAGMAPYKRFLDAVAARLMSLDPDATVFIGDPGR